MSVHRTLTILGLLAAASTFACAPSEPTDTKNDDTDVVETDDSDVADTDTTDDTDPDETDETDDTEVQVISCADVGITPTVFAPSALDAASFAVRGRFPEAAPTLLASCAEGYAESVLRFVAPTTGLWELSTDGPGTTSATLLSLRDACDDLTERACDVEGAGRYGARVTAELTAGDAVIVVLQASTDAPRGWQLTARPVTAAAAIGDACDASVSCASGSSCVDTEPAATCVASTAPEITEHSIVWRSSHTARHTLSGTDADADVFDVWLVRALAEDGEVYGDDPGERPLRLAHDAFRIDPTTGTWTVGLDVSPNLFAFFVTPIVAFDIAIEDAAGHFSTDQRAFYPEIPTAETVLEHAACDLFGFPRACESTTVCVDDGSGVGVCTLPSAPVLTSASIAYGVDANYEITVVGSDATRDATAMKVLVTFDNATTKTYTLNFNDAGTTWTGDSFVARRAAAFYGSTALPVGASVWVTDKKTLASETLPLAWPPTAFTTLEAGEACTVGAETSACADGLVCGADLFGATTCAAPQAPELYAVDFSVNATTGWVEARIDGADLNGDVYGANFAFTTAEYRGLEGVRANSFVPAPGTSTFFETVAMIEDVHLQAYDYVRVELVDATGLRSNPILVPFQGESALDEWCAQGVLANLCDLNGGLACGMGDTCEVAEAPVVTQVVAHRLSEGDIGLDFAGSDANGDARDVSLAVDVDGELTELTPFVLPTPGIFGLGTFEGAVTLKGWGTQGDAIAVRLQVRDLTDRQSTPITVIVPPIVALGGTCSGDDTVDRCEDGSSCDEGTCAQHTPQIVEVFTQDDNHGRDLLISVLGSDAEGVLKSAKLVFSGGGADEVKTLTVGSSSSYPHVLTWDDGDFLLEITVPGWGTETQAPRTGITVTLTDDVALQSEAVSGAILPVRNVGESCDTTGVEDRCQAGLMCDEGACVIDTADACAGIDVLDTLTHGHVVDDAIVVTLDMNAGTAVDEAFCPTATYSKAKGPEHVVRFVPDRSGTLQIQSVTPDADQLFVRVVEGQCVDPALPLACARNDAATTVSAVEGVPLYIQVDTYYLASGRAELWLTWVP